MKIPVCPTPTNQVSKYISSLGWGDVIWSEGIGQRKHPLFFPQRNKSSFHQENQNNYLRLLNHAAFSGNGLSPLPYLPACWPGSPAGLHPPDASRPACAWGEWHGVPAWSELHRLGKEHVSRKDTELLRQIIMGHCGEKERRKPV